MSDTQPLSDQDPAIIREDALVRAISDIRGAQDDAFMDVHFMGLSSIPDKPGRMGYWGAIVAGRLIAASFRIEEGDTLGVALDKAREARRSLVARIREAMDTIPFAPTGVANVPDAGAFPDPDDTRVPVALPLVVGGGHSPSATLNLEVVYGEEARRETGQYGPLVLLNRGDERLGWLPKEAMARIMGALVVLSQTSDLPEARG